MQLLYLFIRSKRTQSFGERDDKVRTALKQTNNNNEIQKFEFVRKFKFLCSVCTASCVEFKFKLKIQIQVLFFNFNLNPLKIELVANKHFLLYHRVEAFGNNNT